MNVIKTAWAVYSIMQEPSLEKGKLSISIITSKVPVY
jgi:hypothetical protein